MSLTPWCQKCIIRKPLFLNVCSSSKAIVYHFLFYVTIPLKSTSGYDVKNAWLLSVIKNSNFWCLHSTYVYLCKIWSIFENALVCLCLLRIWQGCEFALWFSRESLFFLERITSESQSSSRITHLCIVHIVHDTAEFDSAAPMILRTRSLAQRCLWNCGVNTI